MNHRALSPLLSLAITLVVMITVSRADVLEMPSGQTNLETVWILDANNPSDPTTAYGSIGYAYEMGKYEVTNAQYSQFLNANLPDITSSETTDLLSKDRYGLYNRNMEIDSIGGINYSPVANNGAKFQAKVGYENRPVNFVSWYDAIRFANWLQNGQGTGGTEYGTYEIEHGGVNSGTVVIPDAATRGTWDPAHRHWVLPSENEWYKAAYYQPAAKGGDSDGYWAYPSKSNSPPVNTHLTPDPGNHANFYDNSGTGNHNYTLEVAPYTTAVGDFEKSASYYGTFDQGGNVWEWNEALIGTSRGWRGGSYYYASSEQLATFRASNNPSMELSIIGFRVANVPEPSSIVLLLCGTLAGLVWWRRR